MPKQSARTVNQSSPHPVHYHKAGNILVQAQAVLFRVHRDKLARCSTTLKDMITSAPVVAVGKRSTSEKIPKIELPDDSNEVALLLDFTYQYKIDYRNVEKTLRLTLLAHKYDAPLLLSTCLDHIKTLLPTGLAAKDFRAADRYRQDHSLIPLALRVTKLANAPNIMPWAIYMLSTQPSDPKHAWFAHLPTEDQLFIKSFSKRLQTMKRLKQDLANKWNNQISDYMFGGCIEGNEICLRQAPDDDRDDCVEDLSIGSRDLSDPLYTISVFLIPRSGSDEFCRSCEGDLSERARSMVEKVFNSMRVVSQGS